VSKPSSQSVRIAILCLLAVVMSVFLLAQVAYAGGGFDYGLTVSQIPSGGQAKVSSTLGTTYDYGWSNLPASVSVTPWFTPRNPADPPAISSCDAYVYRNGAQWGSEPVSASPAQPFTLPMSPPVRWDVKIVCTYANAQPVPVTLISQVAPPPPAPSAAAVAPKASSPAPVPAAPTPKPAAASPVAKVVNAPAPPVAAPRSSPPAVPAQVAAAPPTSPPAVPVAEPSLTAPQVLTMKPSVPIIGVTTPILATPKVQPKAVGWPVSKPTTRETKAPGAALKAKPAESRKGVNVGAWLSLALIVGLALAAPSALTKIRKRPTR
jgi:hypothetical protein